MKKFIKALIAIIVSLCTFALSLAVIPLFISDLTVIALIGFASYLVKLSINFMKEYD